MRLSQSTNLSWSQTALLEIASVKSASRQVDEKRQTRTSGTLNALEVGILERAPAQVGVRDMSHNPSIALTTPSGRFAPLPRTDRPLSFDEFLYVIAVGS